MKMLRVVSFFHNMLSTELKFCFHNCFKYGTYVCWYSIYCSCHIALDIWQIGFCFAGGVLCARWYCVHIDPVNSGDFRTAQLHSTTTVPVDQRRHHSAVPGTGGPVVYRRVRRETDLGGLWGGWTRAGLSTIDSMFVIVWAFLSIHLFVCPYTVC